MRISPAAVKNPQKRWRIEHSKKLKGRKIDNVIMEASSHGLKQHRLDGLQFSTGIFTNLSQDHIDYHKNVRNYFKAKLYLFEKLIKPRGSVITDDKIPEFKKINSISKKRGIDVSEVYNIIKTHDINVLNTNIIKLMEFK